MCSKLCSLESRQLGPRLRDGPSKLQPLQRLSLALCALFCFVLEASCVINVFYTGFHDLLE